MGPGNMMVRRGGPGRQVTENWGNGNINADGAGSWWGGRGEVKTDIKGAFSRVAREATSRLYLNIVFSADKAREGAKEPSNGKDGVPHVVVERALMETAGEKVVSARVALFLAVSAGWRGGLVKEREAELAAEQESVGIRTKMVVREASRKGVERDTRDWREEGGHDVLGSRGERGHSP
jgi:hypothetical protein